MVGEINEKSVYRSRQILVCFAQSIHISIPWPLAKTWKEEKTKERERGKEIEKQKLNKQSPLFFGQGHVRMEGTEWQVQVEPSHLIS